MYLKSKLQLCPSEFTRMVHLFLGTTRMVHCGLDMAKLAGQRNMGRK
jgi:hypothetical protein